MYLFANAVKENVMDVRKALQDERRALQQRFAEIDTILSEYEKLEARASAVMHGPSVTVVGENRAHSDPTARPPKVVESNNQLTPPKEFGRHLRAILNDLTKPIKRKDLLLALRRRGVIVGGKNELNTLGTRLFRLPWVRNISGQGYWLKQLRYAPVDDLMTAMEGKIEI